MLVRFQTKEFLTALLMPVSEDLYKRVQGITANKQNEAF